MTVGSKGFLTSKFRFTNDYITINLVKLERQIQEMVPILFPEINECIYIYQFTSVVERPGDVFQWHVLNSEYEAHVFKAQFSWIYDMVFIILNS